MQNAKHAKQFRAYGVFSAHLHLNQPPVNPLLSKPGTFCFFTSSYHCLTQIRPPPKTRSLQIPAWLLKRKKSMNVHSEKNAKYVKNAHVTQSSRVKLFLSKHRSHLLFCSVCTLPLERCHFLFTLDFPEIAVASKALCGCCMSPTFNKVLPIQCILCMCQCGPNTKQGGGHILFMVTRACICQLSSAFSPLLPATLRCLFSPRLQPASINSSSHSYMKNFTWNYLQDNGSIEGVFSFVPTGERIV